MTVDGAAMTYANLEPITLSGSAANVQITASSADDNLVLQASPLAPGSLQVVSLNNSLESITFARPTASLTINLGAGNDQLAIRDFTSTTGASLTVNDGAGNDTVTVAPGALISTRHVAAGTDPRTAASIGASGTVSISAETITVDPGAQIRADADHGFAGGAITLTAAASSSGPLSDATASIEINGAVVRGASLTLQANAVQSTSLTANLASGLDFTTSASAVIDGASTIDVTGAVTINATASVSASAIADAEAVPFTNVDAAAAATSVTSDVTAAIGGTTSVQAGALSLFANNSVNLTTTADGSPGGANAGGATVAVGVLDVETTASIGDAATIVNASSVGVRAQSFSSANTTAIATAQGATQDSTATQQVLAGNGAATSDGPVEVAAAVAVTRFTGATHAFIDTSGPVTSAGTVSVLTASATHVQTNANGSSVNGGTGVGVAVAINSASALSEAYIGNTTTITAPTVAILAESNDGVTDQMTATAVSGAGATNVGVAGALAINHASDTTRAYIKDGAVLNMPGAQLALFAQQLSSASASATPESATLGVGASVAIDLVNTTVEATIGQGATVHGLATAVLLATGTHAASATANPGGTGGTATSTAAALAVVQNDAAATLSSGARLDATGAVSLGATQTTTSTTSASGAASGGGAAVGAVIALGIVLDQTTADSAGTLTASDRVSLAATGITNSSVTSTSSARGTSAQSAKANPLIARQLAFLGTAVTVPQAATADGSVDVAAALAVGVTKGTVSATVSGGTLTTTGALSLAATGAVEASVVANAQATNGAFRATGIGNAVAIDVGTSTITASIDTTASATGVSLSSAASGDGSLFTAQAISGAGAANVGVAGALALNVVDTDSDALIDSGGNVTASAGQLALSAADTVDTSTSAQSQVTPSSQLGVGASVSVDIVDDNVRAAVANGAVARQAGDALLHFGDALLQLIASGNDVDSSTATTGATGGTASASTVALTYAQHATTAQLESGGQLNSTGSVKLDADQSTNTDTSASGAAVSPAEAVGAVLGIGIVRDGTIADSAGTLVAGGPVQILADGDTISNTSATASARGDSATGTSLATLTSGQLALLGNPSGVTVPAAQDADGAVNVAAALGIGVSLGTVAATVSGGTLTTTGTLSLAATGAVGASVEASGQTTNNALTGTGVGSAVAIDVGSSTITASIDTTASATGVSLSTAAGGDGGSFFTAQAISGAGSADVGVAGALALNVVDTDSDALIGSDGDVTASAGQLALSAANEVHTDASAQSQATPQSQLGVGASVSVDIVDDNVRAAVADGAVARQAGNALLTQDGALLQLVANGDDVDASTATAGAAGGTATASTVALTYAQHTTEAQLESGGQINAGSVKLQADQSTDTNTTASGAAASSTAAVGAVLGVGIVRDNTIADSAGTMVAGGAVRILADGDTTSSTNATASVRGSSSTGTPLATLTSAQLAFLGTPSGVTVPAAQDADGTVNVAAALGVGVTLGTVAATVSSGRVTTQGTLTLSASGAIEGDTLASSRSLNVGLVGTGIGGAVALNVGTAHFTAQVNTGISVGGLVLSTSSTEGQQQPSEFSATAQSGRSSSVLGIAGSLAINVASTDSEAVLTPHAQVNVNGGNISVTAGGGAQTSATATAQPSTGDAVGVGASVAINVAFDTTHGALDQSQISNGGNLSIAAQSQSGANALAVAGTNAANATAGAVSINFADRSTIAEVTAGGPTLTLAGALSLAASEVGGSSSVANANDLTTRTAGIGTALAINVPLDGATARLLRNTAVGQGISITAQSQSNAGSQAIASQVGAADTITADQHIADWLGFIDAGSADGDAPSLPGVAGAVAKAATEVGITVPSFGAAAAISANAEFGDTEATIGANLTVTAGGLVSLEAFGHNGAASTANSSAVRSAANASLALGFDFTQTVFNAKIGDNDRITAGAIGITATIQSDFNQDSTAAAIASTAGAAAGVAGAIAVDLVADTTSASIGQGAVIVATGGVQISATSHANATSLSGIDANSAVDGAGVALSVNLVSNQTLAFIDKNATVDSANVLFITAQGTQSLDAEAESGAGGGNDNIPASISINAVDASTLAYTASGVAINQHSAPASTQTILLTAAGSTFFAGQAGGAGAGGSFGVGASADFGFLKQDTEATIDGTTSAGGGIALQATSLERVSSQATSNGETSAVDVAGSAAVQIEDITTRAFIPAGLTVHAGGSILLSARDDNDLDAIAGARDTSVGATAGAGIAVASVTKTVEAFVDSNAVVDADGSGPAINANNGFTITYVPDEAGPGEVGRPFLPNALTDLFNVVFDNPLYTFVSNLLQTDASFLDITPVSNIPDNPSVDQTRLVTPSATAINGLAITALSHDDISTSGSGYGAAFAASPQFSFSGTVVETNISAFIGSGARINTNNAAANAAQSVLVNAASDIAVLNIAGSITAAGVASVGPAATLALLAPVTEAFIGAGAIVRAPGNIEVVAKGTEDLVAVPTGLVASALISASGSLGVISVDSTTYAFIDQNANVDAHDSILVSASDDTKSEPVAGALSLTLGSGLGFGTSAVTSLISKDVQAYIASGAVVEADAFGGNSVISLDQDTTSDTPTTPINGLSVLAMSSEQITDLAVSAQGSRGIGIAGAVSVELIAVSTQAHIDAGAQINTGTTTPNIGQSVAVGAYDNTQSFGVDVNLTAGSINLAGGVDLDVIRNSTRATIATGAVVNAHNMVNVVARSRENVNSFIGGAGFTGFIGIVGSVSAVSIGQVIGPDLLDPLTAIGGPETVQGYIDSQIADLAGSGTNTIAGVLDSYAEAVGGQHPIATAIQQGTPTAPVTTAVNAGTLDAGTVAAIDGATVTAGNQVNVIARDKVEAASDTSFTYDFSLGALLSIKIDAGLIAGRANASATITDGAVVSAGHDITVASDADSSQTLGSTVALNNSADNSLATVDGATLTAGGNISVTANGTTEAAYSALLPGFSGFKFYVSDNTLRNTIEALVENGATVTATGQVNVTATDSDQVVVKANATTLKDKGIAGAMALGATFALNDVADTVTAGITAARVTADSVTVSATASPQLTTLALGIVQTSNIGIGGGTASNEIADTIHAFIDDGATVEAANDISVTATDNTSLTAISGGAVFLSGLAIGVAISDDTVDNVLTAEIASNAIVTSDRGSVAVTATDNASSTSAAVGLGEAANVATGGSLPVNTFTETVTAQIDHATVQAVTGVTVAATDNSSLRSLAGTAAVTPNQLALGAAIANNTMSDRVEALVTDASVQDASGDVSVAALSTSSLSVLAAGFSGASSVGAAGSVSINTMNSVIEAGVLAGATIVADAVTVSANDHSQLRSLTGAAAASGNVSISGSVSENIVSNRVLAHVDDATITTSDLAVVALAIPSITAIAIAGSASGTVSAQGGVTLNSLGSEVTAEISNNAVIQGGGVQVIANDGAVIQSLAGGFGGSQIEVGGSLATNDLADTIHAAIDTAAAVTASAVQVQAIDDENIAVFAGAAGGASTFASGASAALNQISNTNEADVDDATIDATSLAVSATSLSTIKASALTANGAGTVAGVLTVATNTIQGLTDAHITDGATIALGTGSLTVTAADTSRIQSLSGAATGSGTASIAAAASFSTIGNANAQTPSGVTGMIEGGAQVTAGNVSIASSFGGEIDTIAIGGAAAGSAAAAASVATSTIAVPVTAAIRDAGTVVTASGSIAANATDGSTINALAGNFAGAGAVAGGAAVVIDTIHNTVDADITAAQVTNTGIRSSISLSATSTSAIEALAGAGVFSGTASIAGAVTTNTIGSTIEAFIAGDTTVSAGRSVVLSALDDATIDAGAASLQISGVAALGTGIATNDVADTVSASIETAHVDAALGTVSLAAQADGAITSGTTSVSAATELGLSGAVTVDEVANSITAVIGGAAVVSAAAGVSVSALDSTGIKSLASQFSAGFVFGGGAAAYNSIDDVVQARIDSAMVTSNGNISVSALDNSTIQAIAAGGSIGVVGLAGSVAVNLINNDVEAFASNAILTSLGNVTIAAASEGSQNTWAGTLTGAVIGLSATVAVDNVETTTRADVENSTIVAAGNGAPSTVPTVTTSGQVGTASVSGLAVVAIDAEALDIISATGAGGIVSVAGNVSFAQIEDTTQAFISASTVGSEAAPAAGVAVRALQGSSVSLEGGALAVGVVGVAGAVSTTFIGNTTEAWIGDDNEPFEGRGASSPSSIVAHSIEITASAVENVNQIVIGVAGGEVGVAGSVSYVQIDNTTLALAQRSSLEAIGGTGTIAIGASDNSSITEKAGSGAGGLVGIGGAVSVNEIGNDTEATLAGATLNATGAITVLATSSEAIDALTGAVGIGLGGIAGAVAVNTINSQTLATLTSVGTARNTLINDTLINQDPDFQAGGNFAGGSGQSVKVSTADTASIQSTLGTLGGGLVGAGASIDVEGIRNRVATEATDGTQIQATGNVSLLAASERSLDSTAIALAGGAIGLAGAFSILSLGAPVDGTGAGKFTSALQGNIDSGLALNGNSINGNDGALAEQTQDFVNFGAKPTIDATLDPNAPDAAATEAVVDDAGAGGNVVITSGGTITVDASNAYHLQSTDGSGGGGIVGIGVAQAYVDVGDTVAAHVGNQATLSASQDISVAAHDNTDAPTTVNLFTGEGGILAANGSFGNVAVTLNVAATFGDDVVVTRADTVSVTAAQSANLQINGLDSVGGIAGAGGVSMTGTISGDVTAALGVGDEIGSASSRVGSLIVQATGNDSVLAITEAAAGGILGAGDLTVANALIGPTISALIGSGTAVFSAGGITVSAGSTGNAFAVGEGVAIGGGAAFSAVIANADLASSAVASLGTSVHLDALGAINIDASHLTLDQVTADTAASAGAGLVGGAGAESDANSAGTAKTEIGAGSFLSAGQAVNVVATAGNDAFASAVGVDFGAFLAVGSMRAEADDDGAATAQLDANVTIRGLSLSVIGAAADRGTADAQEADGGLITFDAEPNAGAFVTVSPHVSALIGAEDNVNVPGNVKVEAIDLPEADTSDDGTSIGGITVGISRAHSVVQPQIQASVGQGSAVAAGGNIDVLVQNGESAPIANGNFQGNAALSGLNEILFAQTGALQVTLLDTGDQVVYHANGGQVIGGLTDGRTYDVIANTPNTVQLGQVFDASTVNSDTDTISFTAPQLFQTGDKIVYDSNGGPAIGGLVNGGTYFVRVIDGHTIKLASTLAQATQPDLVFGASSVDPTTGAIALAGNGFTNGAAVTYRTTGTPIAGLVNGQTYYVIAVDSTHFKLSATPGGTAIAINASGASGVQSIGVEGVDLDASGVTGTQKIVFALGGGGTGTQSLTGVGGPIGGLLSYVGDGKSTATALGSNGSALFGDRGSEALVVIGGSTSVGAQSDAVLIAGQNVAIGSQLTDKTNVLAGSSSDSFIAAIGSSDAETRINVATTATLGSGAEILASGGVTMSANSTYADLSHANSEGGAFIADGEADDSITVLQSTQVRVAAESTISAGGDVALSATTDYQGAASAFADNGGFGSAATTNVTYAIGSLSGDDQVPVQQNTAVSIGNGADVTTPGSVTITAEVSEIRGTVSGESHASGVGSDPELDGNRVVPVAGAHRRGRCCVDHGKNRGHPCCRSGFPRHRGDGQRPWQCRRCRCRCRRDQFQRRVGEHHRGAGRDDHQPRHRGQCRRQSVHLPGPGALQQRRRPRRYRQCQLAPDDHLGSPYHLRRQCGRALRRRSADRHQPIGRHCRCDQRHGERQRQHDHRRHHRQQCPRHDRLLDEPGLVPVLVERSGHGAPLYHRRIAGLDYVPRHVRQRDGGELFGEAARDRQHRPDRPDCDRYSAAHRR